MNRKALFMISFIGFIASLIVMGNTITKYQNDVKAINEHHDQCLELGNALNKNKAELDHLDNSFTRNSLVDAHNYQVAQYNALC